MKHLLGLVAFLSVFLACIPKPPAAAASPEVVTVQSWREFSLTLHADTSFTDAGRARIQAAAAKWRAASAGHIRISVVFDLDFDSIENLKEHQAANHSLLVGVLSDYDIVRRLDEMLGDETRTPLAATVRGEDATLVFLILDRIQRDDFTSVVTHEFGHVAGLPDLPTFGSVMSGARLRGEESVNEFTRDDLVLCRAAKLCP